MSKEDYERLMADMFTAETFLNAQGLPWLARQARRAGMLLMRDDVERFILELPQISGDSK